MSDTGCHIFGIELSNMEYKNTEEQIEDENRYEKTWKFTENASH